MQTYAITITPHNKNKRCNKDLYNLVFQNEIEIFMKSFMDVKVNEMNYEQCKKGKSKGKWHVHGVIQIRQTSLDYFKLSVVEYFGYNGSKRCLDLIPIFNPSGWNNYIRKEFVKNNSFLF